MPLTMKLQTLAIVLVLFDRSICDFGGHDLFTSLAQLEVLWRNELEIVQKMEEVAAVNETVGAVLKDYIAQHRRLGLDTVPNYNFLGHPINAYFFVRHVANGWSKVRDAIQGVDFNTTMQDLAFLGEREKEKLPSLYDVEGAAFGLIRLHQMYKYDIAKFTREGVISTVLDNGQVVISKASVLNLTSYDLSHMAKEAVENGLYDSACDFMEAAESFAQEEFDRGEDFSWLYDYKPDPEERRKLTKEAKRVHDHFLDTRGMMGRLHRTHQFPYDKKLRKKKKFKKSFKLDKPLLERKATEDALERAERSQEEADKVNFVSEVQMDQLCRGKQLRSDLELSKLYCTYAHGDSAWLRLGPIKMELNSFDPFHVVLRHIMTHDECDDVTRFLGPRLDFPPGRMDHKSRKNDWTMKNTWPRENEHRGLEKLNRRIEHLSGLRADSSKHYSEGFMCGNYGIGGWYFIHPDFHPRNNYNSEALFTPYANGGNRMSTVLTILEAPEAGGATVWPNAGITVFPEKGSAVWWYNLRKSDFPDYFTRHAACPVILGQKWIGNKWVGYHGQWDKRKCGTDPMERFDGPYS